MAIFNSYVSLPEGTCFLCIQSLEPLLHDAWRCTRHQELTAILWDFEVWEATRFFMMITGWCFGTFVIFSVICGNFIIPTDELIFFKMGRSTTNQFMMINNIAEFPFFLEKPLLVERVMMIFHERLRGPVNPSKKIEAVQSTTISCRTLLCFYL